MNQSDRKEFDLIHNKIDNLTQSMDELKLDMDKAHTSTDDNLRFIKENMFNPHEGLWAETKLNTQFRDNTTRWRFPIGVGFISLAVKQVWDLFNPS
ncbi:hypothetical protein HOE22_09560 [Candidatus Woesearchaeota archaeon]|nr:hypothetical protein [Candidatus Woesearchaeota archaeon]MBT6129368.1 hypothetical protein [Candidatus Neomarinimicrobiota bacterium]MBT7555911.1 hypothetical protein [Candidatus Woesearchaeota archaeon]